MEDGSLHFSHLSSQRVAVCTPSYPRIGSRYAAPWLQTRSGAPCTFNFSSATRGIRIVPALDIRCFIAYIALWLCHLRSRQILTLSLTTFHKRLPLAIRGYQSPHEVEPHPSLHLRQCRLSLRKPERHVHGAVQRNSSRQLSAGLLHPSYLGIQRAEAAVAVAGGGACRVRRPGRGPGR